MTHRPLLAFALAGLAALTGCPETGVVCTEGHERCGTGCADLASDRRNCGTCGLACQVGQICKDSKCECQSGSQPCDGECVVIDSDPRHCSACNAACAAGEVCEQGACKHSCLLPGLVRCGNSCVNLATDALHCGACGNACENSQSCHGGFCSYDVVAACLSNGQLTGVQSSSDFKGPNEPLGSGPAALASFQDVLLVADGIDKRLFQARLTSANGHAFTPYPGAPDLGAVPNQVLVADPFVYVVNAEAATLQILRRDAADGGAADAGELDGGGRFPQGLRLGTVAELNFGPNTYPEGLALQGDGDGGSFAYLPLYGGFGATAAAAGQKVLKVDVTNPLAPATVAIFDLSALDLQPFDGGSPVPRPYAIAAHGEKLYVALNNLNPDTYAVEGPGLLARIDPLTGAVTTVALGPSCLNPIWLVSSGARLYVSCQGKATYDGNWALVAVEGTGVVALENDALVANWTAACAPDAGSCLPIIASRFAVSGGKLYVGDQNGGRLFVLDAAGALAERRGYFAPGGAAPIQACAVNATLGFSNVSDVIAIP